MDQTAIGSSSSEATESENSCTERYDYEKTPTTQNNKTKQQDKDKKADEEEEEEGEEDDDEEGRSLNDEKLHIINSYDEAPPHGETMFHELDFLRENNTAGRTLRSHDRYFIEDQQQQQRSKRNFQRPASLKSIDSYDYRETSVGRRHFTMENNVQHEHYMIPTHEPNRSNGKRTMSLFNPDFLPNFNDMLMYVGNTGITRDRDYYRCNVDQNEWSNDEANNTSIIDFSSRLYDRRNNDRREDESSYGDAYNVEQDADYASIHQMAIDVRAQRGQDCENIYAPVGFHGLKSQGRNDYDR